MSKVTVIQVTNGLFDQTLNQLGFKFSNLLQDSAPIEFSLSEKRTLLTIVAYPSGMRLLEQLIGIFGTMEIQISKWDREATKSKDTDLRKIFATAMSQIEQKIIAWLDTEESTQF